MNKNRIKGNIAHILMERATENPCKKLFVFLQSNEAAPVEWTYIQWAEKVKELSAFFSGTLHSKSALLLYADNAEFICAFLACQLSGIIAIPMYPPRSSRHSERLLKIITDSGVTVILTTHSEAGKVKKIIGKETDAQLTIVTTDSYLQQKQEYSNVVADHEQDISFIQYTSGSTGDPKGVVITHDNLLHNQQLINDTFKCNESSVICSWLPFYHDMGLIGNILHTIFAGCTAVLMSPFDFMQQPKRWLDAITKYNVTHSGGPNFAYDRCVNEINEPEEFNLSSWKVAYNGSEPVHPETMERFSKHFRKSGFSKRSFHPCYGLAEATLLVSGVTADQPYNVLTLDADQLKTGNLKISNEQDVYSKKVSSSGPIAEGMQVKIVNAETGMLCGEFQTGEICIAGKSVSSGYFGNNKNASFFLKHNSERYFKTGDIGFMHEDHLYVIGRIKEMLIIRGKNYYPHDIELAAGTAHEAIAKNGVAAFSFNAGAGEELVLFVEISRGYVHTIVKADVLTSIETRIIEEIGIKPLDVVLLNQMSIPRTSSGKIQRFKCARQYKEKNYNPLSSLLVTASGKKNVSSEKYHACIKHLEKSNSQEHIVNYLEQVFILKLPAIPIPIADTSMELTTIGIDSLRAMEIVNMINKDLQINLDATKIYQENTFQGLISAIETTRWLANKETIGNELFI